MQKVFFLSPNNTGISCLLNDLSIEVVRQFLKSEPTCMATTISGKSAVIYFSPNKDGKVNVAATMIALAHSKQTSKEEFNSSILGPAIIVQESYPIHSTPGDVDDAA